MSESAPIVALQGASKCYGAVRALREADIELRAGEVRGLVGENRAGKEGETFKAGELGTKTIGKNGEILLGPPQVFDKSNIDQFDF